MVHSSALIALGLIMWPLVLLVLGAWAQSEEDREHTFKLAACMNLLRFQIKMQEENLNTLVSQSKFEHNEVMTKIMGETLVKCMHSLPLELAASIVKLQGDSLPAPENLKYASLPDIPILTEQALELTDEEYAVLTEIKEKTKRVEDARARGEVPVTEPETQPAIGTSLGLVYILVVFLAFAGLVVYGIKRLNDREKKSSRKKPKRQ